MHLHGVKRIEVRIDVWLWPTTSQPTHSNPLRPLRPLRRLAILDHWYWYRTQHSRRLREWLLWESGGEERGREEGEWEEGVGEGGGELGWGRGDEIRSGE